LYNCKDTIKPDELHSGGFEMDPYFFPSESSRRVNDSAVISARSLIPASMTTSVPLMPGMISMMVPSKLLVALESKESLERMRSSLLIRI